MENTNPETAPLLKTVADASEFCYIVENAVTFEREEFVRKLVVLLPRLYLDFVTAGVDADDVYSNPQMLDETAYNDVRTGLQRIFGVEDVYLETFEEDMKFSDTPIAASISESLADIYQDLYDFSMHVRLSEGSALTEAAGACRENFRLYWSRVLCNVMRPLNNLYLNGFPDSED